MNEKNAEPLVKEIVVKASVQKVWKAITDKNEMKNWYFDLSEFKAEVGFEFQFYGGKEEREYLHLCKIIEVIENQKLIYSWKYDGYPGESFVTFELFDEGGKTRVKLTHEGLESFPADKNPDLAKDNFVKGWNMIIGTLLKDYIEKN